MNKLVCGSRLSGLITVFRHHSGRGNISFRTYQEWGFQWTNYLVHINLPQLEAKFLGQVWVHATTEIDLCEFFGGKFGHALESNVSGNLHISSGLELKLKMKLYLWGIQMEAGRGRGQVVNLMCLCITYPGGNRWLQHQTGMWIQSCWYGDNPTRTSHCRGN